MIPYSLYIIDDEVSLTKAIARIFENDFSVSTFSSAEAAIKSMADSPPDLVLLDIGLPGMNGITALQRIKDDFPDILVVMITAYEEIETVVSAMKHGAYDYVVKPIQMDSLEVTVKNALESIRLRKEVKLLHEKYLKENLPCFIGNSKVIQDVMQFVENVAQSPDTPILILGESGTGKELIASAIHYRSPNFRGPMITVNCAAIPKDLIESELFGYEKGAFSGASVSGKKGLVEQAHGGTLFLDEVGDLNIEAQAKLLRFIEEGEFYKIGGVRKIRVSTRIVSATNKDIIHLIEKGQFRSDLYYRLGVIKIKIPSLSNRKEDIIPIAKYFLVKFSEKFGKTITGISPEAQKVIEEYRWHGNVRELKNIIEQAALTAKGSVITSRDLAIDKPAGFDEDKTTLKEDIVLSDPSDEVDLPSLMKSIERRYVEQALKMSDGNEARAAQTLNINYSTFRYKRRTLQIP